MTKQQACVLARGEVLDFKRRRPRRTGQQSFLRVQTAAVRLKKKVQQHPYDARLATIFHGVIALQRIPLPWGVGVAQPAACPATVIRSLLANVSGAFRQRFDAQGVVRLLLDDEALSAALVLLRRAQGRFGTLVADLDAIGAIDHPILGNPDLKPLWAKREQAQAVVVVAETLHSLLSCPRAGIGQCGGISAADEQCQDEPGSLAGL